MCGPLCVFSFGTSGRPLLHDQSAHGHGGVARSNRPGNAGPRGRVAEELRQRFLHVPGVKKVDIVGEQQERIFVEFSYSRLTMLGISPAEIFSALARQNAVTPAGSVDTDGAQVFVRLDGAYTDID